jgi:hypothetical protein
MKTKTAQAIAATKVTVDAVYQVHSLSLPPPMTLSSESQEEAWGQLPN